MLYSTKYDLSEAMAKDLTERLARDRDQVRQETDRLVSEIRFDSMRMGACLAAVEHVWGEDHKRNLYAAAMLRWVDLKAGMEKLFPLDVSRETARNQEVQYRTDGSVVPPKLRADGQPFGPEIAPLTPPEEAQHAAGEGKSFASPVSIPGLTPAQQSEYIMFGTIDGKMPF